jgi:hypothetical protein
MSIKSNIAELQAFLADQPTYSTHEHLRYESDAVKSVECEQEDILWLYTLHYTKSDLISSGATKADVAFIGNPQHSFVDRHHRLSKFGARSQNTTQMKTLHAALRALYGGDIFDLNQATEMETRRKEIHRAGLYREILQEKGKLQLLCRDWGDEFREQQYFRTAVRMEEWIGISSLCDLQKLESESDRSILNLADLTSVVREQAEKLIAKGAIAFKNAMIYQRNPAWVRRSTFDAENAFSILTKYLHADWVSNGSAWRPELQPLQDYLYGEICALAAERNVPMQIHTGLPEGNCLPLDWGDPTHFLELIRCFPKLEIHLMHLGHPYEPYAIAMAKMLIPVQAAHHNEMMSPAVTE